MNKTIDPQVIRQRLEVAFFTLDIATEVERHTGTRLSQPDSRKQFNGACPYGDCSADTNGFIVWSELSKDGNHFHCRGCKRSGDILKLVQDIKALGFTDACIELGIPNPYLDGESGAIHSKPLVKRRTSKVEQWQLDELDYLTNIYQRAKLALQCDRARSYLSERAIPFELAEAQGLGYIPALSKVSHVTPELERFRRWCDRIIFPIFTPKGEIGYCGRSLFLWESGMDEDEHKRRIDAYNLQMKEQHSDKALWHQMPRWKYTYKQGFFNWQAVKEFDTLAFVEGPFDTLACKAAGILNAIPIGTTGIDVGMLPISVCAAVIGLDIDGPGSNAAKRLATGLRRKGIDTQVCAPTGGKDWSATYRLSGVQGLVPLTEALANRLVCERCSISNSLSSNAFQIREGKTLCHHCAVASIPPAATDQDDSLILAQVYVESLAQGFDPGALPEPNGFREQVKNIKDAFDIGGEEAVEKAFESLVRHDPTYKALRPASIDSPQTTLLEEDTAVEASPAYSVIILEEARILFEQLHTDELFNGP